MKHFEKSRAARARETVSDVQNQDLAPGNAKSEDLAKNVVYSIPVTAFEPQRDQNIPKYIFPIFRELLANVQY